jgi:uncharacterized membrane protein YgcG
MKKALLIGLLLLFSISLVFAAQPLPHAFEGQIFSEDDSLTSGKTLIAKVSGAATGQATIDGNSFKITVIDNIGSGGLIEFFMGDEKAGESFYFKAFEVTKTNLTFDTIPDETIGSCGDGICAVEECSFCAIDCPISKCMYNNICDAAIGEDYITAPNDCHKPTTSSGGGGGSSGGSSGGGSSGGGGGGSSGGGGTTTNDNTILLSNDNSSTSDGTIKDIETLNEEIKQEVEKVGTGTGAVIGFVKSPKGIGLGIGLVFLIAGSVVFFVQRKDK